MQALRRSARCFLLPFVAVFLAASPMQASKKDKQPPDWKTGHVMDENKAREFAGTYHNRQSSTTNNGSISATANTSDYGYGSNTNINGSYSGTSSTSTSGFDAPMYRVYENLIVEGDDMIYITSERLVWRWSKGPRVTVNGEVKYYVDGSKLHLVDDTGKERTIPIIKQVRKVAAPPAVTSTATQSVQNASTIASTATASLTIKSNPAGADIEIDGNFVGNTPSSIEMQSGEHNVKLTKAGYQPWERKLKTTTGSINISSDLVPSATHP